MKSEWIEVDSNVVGMCRGLKGLIATKLGDETIVGLECREIIICQSYSVRRVTEPTAADSNGIIQN